MRLSVSPAFGRLSQIANWTGTRVVCGLAMLVGLLAMPVAAGAQAVTGTLLGNVTDSSGARRSRGDGHRDVKPRPTSAARRSTQRIRLLHLLQPAERHLLRRGRAAGLQEGHAAERQASTSTRRCAWT